MTFVQQVADANSWPGTTSATEDAANPTHGAESLSNSQEPSGFLAHSRRASLLNRAVEVEILPRLALLRAAVASAPNPAELTTDDDTAELVKHLLGNRDEGAWTFVEALERRGVTPASLYLGVVTEAARRLGEMWEDDRCGFAQVTISLGRLQQIVRALAPGFQKDAVTHSEHANTILLLPAPEEQHTFGLVILGEFFQREGWRVVGGPVSTGYDAPAMVQTEWVDVAGFSVGSANRLDRLAATIRAIRRASVNRNISIMVGGPLFLRRPDLVARVGADTTAPDAPTAIRQARTLLSLRAAVN